MNAYFGSVDLTKASPITQIPLPMATLKKTVRVAAAQMTSVNDLIANFNTCSRLVQVNSFPDQFDYMFCVYVADEEFDSKEIAIVLRILNQRNKNIFTFSTD